LGKDFPGTLEIFYCTRNNKKGKKKTEKVSDFDVNEIILDFNF
tara:strand:+ start:430 stop:558 length:129 start_codon:yes stop_codon:yes gene_type:complete